jgi:hypothetical protein
MHKTMAMAMGLLLLGASVARAQDDGEGEATGTDGFSHKGQFGVHIQPGTGYRVLFPYNEEYCGQADKAVCTGRSPVTLTVGLSFGVTAGLELLGEVQLGLESDFSGLSGAEGPAPLFFAAGARLYVDSDGQFKFFSTLEGTIETTDYTENGVLTDSGTDFGIKNVNGIQFDFHRVFGLYVHFGESVSFVNWLRFDLQGGIGLQARFP